MLFGRKVRHRFVGVLVRQISRRVPIRSTDARQTAECERPSRPVIDPLIREGYLPGVVGLGARRWDTPASQILTCRTVGTPLAYICWHRDKAILCISSQTVWAGTEKWPRSGSEKEEVTTEGVTQVLPE